MSTMKTAPPEHDIKPPVEETASVIDTSKMNEGQRAALEMTEAAREALRKQVTRACGTCADHGCLDCTCEKSTGCH